MKIGTFTKDGDGYTGSICTAGLSIAEVTFGPSPVKQGSGPDFVVLADDDARSKRPTNLKPREFRLIAFAFELGAAWAKTSKKGKPYLSVKLDSPVFVAPINCALIEQIDGSHALVWNRDTRREDEQADEQAAA